MPSAKLADIGRWELSKPQSLHMSTSTTLRASLIFTGAH